MKVEIILPDITGLSTKTKFDDNGLVTSIRFDTKIHPGALARILNLQRQGAPLIATIGSPQATMDLYVHEDAAPQLTGFESEAQP